MKIMLHIGLLLCLAATIAAQGGPKVLKVYDWKNLPVHFPNSQITSTNGVSILKIENTNDSLQKLSLLEISDPSLIKKTYFLLCEVKYKHEGVQRVFGPYGLPPVASLKLLNRLPPSAPDGDGRVSEDDGIDDRRGFMYGESNWRLCQFMVDRDAFEGLPTQLELELRFSGQGTVYLRPIKLFGKASNFGSWWSPQQAGLIGGIGGSLIGCFGGLIGLLVSKGKARNFVLASVKCFIALGILLTIAGLIAMALKQPYAVWYALLLPGVILVLVFPLNLHSIQRRYDELEIRRMTSIDTGS